MAHGDPFRKAVNAKGSTKDSIHLQGDSKGYGGALKAGNARMQAAQGPRNLQQQEQGWGWGWG